MENNKLFARIALPDYIDMEPYFDFAEERRLDEEYKRKLNEIRETREELRLKYVSIERILNK